MAKRIACKLRISKDLKHTIEKMAISEKKSQKNLFLYEVVDSAIEWAKKDASAVSPRLQPKSVEEYSTVYYTKENELEYLSHSWDCSLSNALFTALCCYADNQVGK